MRTVAAMLALAAGAVAAGVARAGCDPSIACEVAYRSGDETYNFAFHDLCLEGGYSISDASGHSYAAQICGNADYDCLPQGWTNTYEYGVAVQSWGAQPTCEHKLCQDHHSGAPKCCSKDCQVLGEGDPSYSLVDPSNPKTGGIRVAFKGAQPSPDDPFYCPWNPVTHSEHQRQVHYYLECDLDYTGPAYLYKAVENSTEHCTYELHFKTAYACGGWSPGLGGGIVFLIVVLVGFSLYLAVFGFLEYRATGKLGWPHKAAWLAGLNHLKNGALYVFRGCKPASGAAFSKPSTTAAPNAGAPLYSGGATSSYQAAASTPSSSSAGRASVPKGTAYTEL